MTITELKKANAEKCLESFREYVNEASKEMAMTCRAAQEVIGKEHSTKEIFSEAAERWFAEIESLSNAEFEFMMLRRAFERYVGGEDDDTEDDGDGESFFFEEDEGRTCS